LLVAAVAAVKLLALVVELAAVEPVTQPTEMRPRQTLVAGAVEALARARLAAQVWSSSAGLPRRST
jgi:hypothetical protein